MLNPPENLRNYVPSSNETKIVRPNYDVLSRQFSDLVGTLGI